jgi:LacI family transcriptional regulator
VIGFDDIPTANCVYPPLTTMRQPFDAIAAYAVREVVGMIAGGVTNPARIAFPAKLVVRESTGPAGAPAAGDPAAGDPAAGGPAGVTPTTPRRRARAPRGTASGT